MLPMELLGLFVSHTNRACCMRRRIEPTGPARTSDIDLTDHENTRRVARARSLSLGDKSLPASIREREKILSSCLRSSLLTIESPYFEQATLLLEKHGAGRSAATCTRSWSSLERRRRAGSRGTGRGASAWRKQQHGALSPIGTPNRWTGVQSDGAADATFSVSIRPSLSCLASVFGKSGAGLSSTTAAAPAFLHPSPAGGRIGLLSLGGGGAVPPLLGSPARLAGQRLE